MVHPKTLPDSLHVLDVGIGPEQDADKAPEETGVAGVPRGAAGAAGHQTEPETQGRALRADGEWCQMHDLQRLSFGTRDQA